MGSQAHPIRLVTTNLKAFCPQRLSFQGLFIFRGAMGSMILAHRPVNVFFKSSSCFTRLVATATPVTIQTPFSETLASPQPPPTDQDPKNTHFKITLRRSAISLGDKLKGTLISLGIHRRHQTVYHKHSSEVAGKILKVKELVEVGNVPEELVRTKEQQMRDRKATRGYKVVRSGHGGFMNA